MEATATRRRHRWAFVLGAVLVALGVVGRSAYAVFGLGETRDQNINAGTLSLTLGGSDPSDNEFNLDATDLVAGDFVMRTVTLTIGGDVPVTGVQLTTDATTSSLLDTGPDGLAFAVYWCSVPFDQMNVGGYPVVTGCSGSLALALDPTPYADGTTTLAGIDVTPGAHNYLAVVMQVLDADATYRNQTSEISFIFTGVQRSGTFK
jgi:hypothetical protein